MAEPEPLARPKKVPLIRRMLTAQGRSLEITKAGWLFILLTLAVGFAAINSGANLLHVLFGCQIGLILASGALSESMVLRARVQRRASSALHAGSRGALTIELRNNSPRGDMISVSVEDDDRVQVNDHCEPVFALAVPGGGATTLHTTVTMERRGLHPLPKAVVATRFPFGLFVKRMDLRTDERVLVYPRVFPIDPETLPYARTGEGEALGARSRAGEFHGLAEFRPGEELRRIHWPATARLGRPVVQEYEARGEAELVLELVAGRSGDERFERAVEQVASEALALLRAGRVAIGLRLSSGELAIEPGVGPAHERRLLEFLALVGEPAESSSPIEPAPTEARA